MPTNELITTSICTWDDVIQNAVIQQEFNTEILNIINEAAVIDSYKVKVDIADASPDFLHAKIDDDLADSDALSWPSAAVVVCAENIASATVKFWVDLTTVDGFFDNDPGTDVRVLMWNAGTMQWVVASGFTDTYQVKVTGSDTGASYLHDAFNLNDTYVGDADLLVATETVGAGGTNQKERPFVDVSAISGWSATGTYILCIVDNISTYLESDSFSTSDELVKCTSGDTTASYLHDAIKDNATYVSGQDGLVASETDGASSTNQKERFFLDSSAISDFASIPDGEAWSLSLARAGSTYTLKWAEAGSSGAAVLKVTALVAGRSGATPGVSSAFTVIDGPTPSQIVNYSTVEITADSYVVVVYTGSQWVIAAAFC